jgi:hypothetical protein
LIVADVETSGNAMTEPKPSSSDALVRVRDEVERRVGSDPAVSLIDVGVDPERERDTTRLAVRIHVRTYDDLARLRAEQIPGYIEGVPVVLTIGDYRLEEPPS